MDIDLLRALADPVRAAIVQALAADELCTCHLVELTGARQTNVSNHLRVLRNAGLVEAEPAGRFTYYRLRRDRLTELGEQLAVLADGDTAGRRRPC